MQVKALPPHPLFCYEWFNFVLEQVTHPFSPTPPLSPLLAIPAAGADAHRDLPYGFILHSPAPLPEQCSRIDWFRRLVQPKSKQILRPT